MNTQAKYVCYHGVFDQPCQRCCRGVGTALHGLPEESSHRSRHGALWRRALWILAGVLFAAAAYSFSKFWVHAFLIALVGIGFFYGVILILWTFARILGAFRNYVR